MCIRDRFFVSFGLVLFHASLVSTEYVHKDKPNESLAGVLVLGAALLPAMVAGIRTYRASDVYKRQALKVSSK